MKILVRTVNWLGDQVLTYPFFYFLRQAYPKAYIASACVPWVQSVQFHHLIDEVIVLSHLQQASCKANKVPLKKITAPLRKHSPWDLGICLPLSFSSAWFMYRAGVKVRRGYQSDFRGFLFNEKLILEKKKRIHRADSFLKLLPEVISQKTSVFEFWDQQATSFHPHLAWPLIQPLEPPTSDYWILAPGSMAESRRWQLNSFIHLAQQVIQETGWPGLILGSRAESAAAEALIQAVGPSLINYTDRGAVTLFWKIFQQAKFTVGNDSGVAHVASLCGCPVHVVWGAGDPSRTRPIGPGKVQLSFNPVTCWPCEKNVCSQLIHQHLGCLKGIQPDEVWYAIKKKLLVH